MAKMLATVRHTCEKCRSFSPNFANKFIIRIAENMYSIRHVLDMHIHRVGKTRGETRSADILPELLRVSILQQLPILLSVLLLRE